MTTPDDPSVARSGVVAASAVQLPPDDERGVLYRGGPVVTVDPAQPRAEAVASRAGHIVAVGTEDDCRRALGIATDASTQKGTDDDTAGNGPGHGHHDRPVDGPVVVDLHGRALLPGFVDAYIHPLALCLAAHSVDLSDARSITDVLDLLSDRARGTERSDWVVGVGLRPERLDEGRLPVATELDKISDGQVVVAVTRDASRSSGSSVALRVAGIRSTSPDPAHGAFERDHQSRLTGVCYETATHVLLGMLPLPDHDTLRDLMRQVGADLVAQGITSIGMGMQTDPEGYGGSAFAHEAQSMMLLVDELPVGCHAILGGQLLRVLDARTASPLHAPAHNRTVTGMSLRLDGSFDGHGAWLHEPYADRPGHRGWPTGDAGRLAASVETAHLAGLQLSLRAVGDAATALALELLADVQARHPRDDAPPHRVEHAALVDDTAVARFAELGVAAVLRPTWARDHGDWLQARLGPERAGRVYPARRLVDAGVLVAAGSGAPAGDLDMIGAVADLVAGPAGADDGALRPDEALALFTRHAAETLGQGHATGSIRPGNRADLVILSDDPTVLPAKRIAELTVCGTVVGGAPITPA